MNDYEKLKKLKEEKEKLKLEIRELERKTSSHFIGVTTIGDGNYYDEYYKYIGVLTFEQANEWIDKQYEKNPSYYDVKVLSVDYEKCLDYQFAKKISEMVSALNVEYTNNRGISNDTFDCIKELHDKLKNEYESFMINVLGLKYPSFMHIV